jgi:hypothetical protein
MSEEGHAALLNLSPVAERRGICIGSTEAFSVERHSLLKKELLQALSPIERPFADYSR